MAKWQNLVLCQPTSMHSLNCASPSLSLLCSSPPVNHPSSDCGAVATLCPLHSFLQQSSHPCRDNAFTQTTQMWSSALSMQACSPGVVLCTQNKNVMLFTSYSPSCPPFLPHQAWCVVPLGMVLPRASSMGPTHLQMGMSMGQQVFPARIRRCPYLLPCCRHLLLRQTRPHMCPCMLAAFGQAASLVDGAKHSTAIQAQAGVNKLYRRQA